jgi:hypothetical protein
MEHWNEAKGRGKGGGGSRHTLDSGNGVDDFEDVLHRDCGG